MFKQVLFVALCFVLAACVAVNADNVGCRGDTGSAVDWFVMFKINDGYSYAYADSRSASLKKSSSTLDMKDSGAFYETVSQIYGSSPTSPNYAFWNDQTPDGHQSESRGHTKGVIGFDDDYGFWLIHSVPVFPAFKAGSDYEGLDDGGTYGQSFFCMTLSTSSIAQVGAYLQNYYPQYYASNIEESMASKMADLQASIDGTHSTSSQASTLSFKTKAGMSLTGFGKPAAAVMDIYNSVISPHFKADTYAETWMNGRNPTPSYCTPDYPYDTLNIRTVSIVGEQWNETQDHSKWCILKDTSTICIGGLNRQDSQQSRYGGLVCFDNDTLYRQLADAIVDMDKCDGKGQDDGIVWAEQ